jgi:TonB family protein
MKPHTRLLLSALTVSLCACAALAQGAAQAQTPAAPWVAVSPEGEAFSVKMPRAPAPRDVSVQLSNVFVGGRCYESAGDDSNTYAVWSLTFTGGRGERLAPESYLEEGVPAGEAFLDLVADFAWEVIVKPEFEEAVTRKESPLPSAGVIRSFELDGRGAREYMMYLRERGGPVYVYSDGRRAYVVAAFGPDPQSPGLKQFVESFTVAAKTPKLPAPVTLKADPLLLGGGGGGGPVRGGDAGAPIDYGKPFKPAEVTKKAVITFKPEPGFTESARRFNVTGVVRIRAVLAASGAVERLTVVKWLPHGLTRRALGAARRIRFEPAQKDGRDVSQYVTLEYNFNIY